MVVEIAHRLESIAGGGLFGGTGSSEQIARAWQDIVTNIPNKITHAGPAGTVDRQGLTQLTDLLKVQMDVCRYQVKVEAVSKIAESAVASMRKLQQPQ